MIRATDVDSLTNFQKNARQIVSELGTSKAPLLLTVNGKAKLVVQDAEAYQAMVDKLERAQFIEAVQRGIEEAKQGLSRPAEEVYEEMKAKYGL